MVVTFKDVLVLEVFQGLSKKGTEIGHIKFLDGVNADVYDVWCFGDDAAKLDGVQPKSQINAISPDLSGRRSNEIALIWDFG